MLHHRETPAGPGRAGGGGPGAGGGREGSRESTHCQSGFVGGALPCVKLDAQAFICSLVSLMPCGSPRMATCPSGQLGGQALHHRSVFVCVYFGGVEVCMGAGLAVLEPRRGEAHFTTSAAGGPVCPGSPPFPFTTRPIARASPSRTCVTVVLPAAAIRALDGAAGVSTLLSLQHLRPIGGNEHTGLAIQLACLASHLPRLAGTLNGEGYVALAAGNLAFQGFLRGASSTVHVALRASRRHCMRVTRFPVCMWRGETALLSPVSEQLGWQQVSVLLVDQIKVGGDLGMCGGVIWVCVVMGMDASLSGSFDLLDCQLGRAQYDVQLPLPPPGCA